MNRRQHIRRLRNYRSQWPHMSSLYSGGTSREDEEQKYVDPVMVFDNVYENPAEPYGAYKFYMAPREEFVIQSEPHLYPVRAVYKEDDDRTSGYATSGGSSTLRDGSSKRILLCVLLIFLLIGAVIAAVVMAVLISHQRRIKPLQPELQQEDVLESNIRIGNRTYILEYSDPNSQEYKLLETEFCEGIDAMFYRIDSPLKTEYKGCKILSFRNGSVIARNLMTFVRKDMKPTQAVKDEVYNFLKETIPKKGIWNPLLLNAESLDIYPVEMINIKPEVDPNYIKPTEDDVSEKSSIPFVSEYVNTKEHTPSSSVLTFQESKQTFPVSDSRDKVHFFSTLGDKEQLYPSQSLHQLIESLSPVHSSKVLSHSTDKLLPSLDYSTGLNPSSTLSPGATHSDIFPQISNIPFDSVRANIDMHLQSLMHFLPMDQQAVTTTPSVNRVADMKNDISVEPVRTPSKSLHLDSTSGIDNDFFNFLNSVPSSHQMQPKSSVGRDQMNINDLDTLLATGDFNKVLFPTSASPVLDETQASVKSQGDLPVYGTSLTKHLLSDTMDQLSSSSLNLDGFFLQSSNLVFPSERFGQTKSTSVLSSLSSSTPPISSIINDMDMFFNNLLPSIPSIKDSSIVSSGTFEQNSNAQLITSSMSQSDSMNFDVTPSDLFDWSDYDIFSGFNQVTTPPSTSTGFSNDLFGNIQESVADDTQSFFDFFSHSSTKEESSNDGLPENVLMNSAQSGTASSSSPTQDLGMSSDQSMFSFLNNVPKGSNKVVDEFDTATHDSIDYDNSLLFQARSGNQQSLITTEPLEASQDFSNSLQPSLSRFITEKSDELGQQSIQSLYSSSVLKSLAHEHLPSPTVEGIKPTTEVTENQSSLKIDLNTDNVKFGGSIQSTDYLVPASSIEMSSLMDGILPSENKVDEILLSSSQREMMSAHLSLKTLELSSKNYFSSENLFPNSDDSISEWNKSSVINTDYISSFSEAYTERFLPLTALPGEQIISSAQKIIDTTMKDAFSISDKKILPTMSNANEIYFTTKGETMSLDHFNSVDESSAHNLMMQSSFLQPPSLSKSEKYAFSVNSLRDISSDDVNSIWGSSIIPLLVQPTKTSTLPLSMEASLNEILEPITLNSQINTTDRQTASREQTNARSSITNEPALFLSLKEDSIQETRLQFNTDEFINPTSASVYIQSSLSEKEGDSDMLLSASSTIQLTQSFVDSVIVTQKTHDKQTSLSFENLMTMSPFDTNINKTSLNTYTEIKTMEFSSGYISSSDKAMTSMLSPLLNPESVLPSSHIMSFNSIDNSVPHLEHESLAETSLIQPSEKSLSSSLRFSSPDVLDFSINDMVSEVASTSMFSSDPVTQHISVNSQISPSEENLIKNVKSKEHIPTETLMFSKEMTPSVEALESLATFTSFSDDSFMKSMEVLDSQSNILQNDITSLPKHEIKNSNIDIALSSLKSQTTDIETSIQSNVMTNTRSSISPSATDIEYESVMSDGILSKNMFYTTIKSDSLQINDLTNTFMPTETLAFQVETTFTDITDSKGISKDAQLSSFTKIKSSDDFLPVQTISSPTQTISIESVLTDFKSSPSINKETTSLSNHFENFDNLQASLDINSSQSYKQNGHTTVISDSLPMFDQTTSMSLNNQVQRLSSARRLSKITEIVDSKTILLDTNSEIMLQSSLSSKMKSLSLNIEKQLESMTSTMQPMPERFIKSHSTSTVESQQLEVVNTFYNSYITDTSSKLFPDSSFTGIIQSSSMVWSEKVALDSSDMSSTLSDMEVVNSLKPTKTEYILAPSATAPLSNTADQEFMTNPLLDQSTLIMDLSSAIEYSKDTKDIFDVFSSSQSTMKLSTVGIIETSVMKQIDEITSEIKQTPLYGQIITTNEFNSQTLGFSKIETVQDDRLSTDALTMLNDGTVFSNMMSSELITIEHSIQTESTEPLTSGVYNTPHISVLSRAYSETNFVPGLLTSNMMYSENLSLASNSFARGKDTDTEMLVFNTFNDLPIASKFQSETIIHGNDLSSNKNNLDLSQSSMLHKEQLSSLRNLQPSMTQLNDVSTFVSNFDIFEITSKGTSYVESARSLPDSPPTEDLKTARVELRTIIENVQGSQIISSQNDATSMLVPTESLNAVFEPFLTSLPNSDKRVTDTLSNHMQTVSFKFSDSSNTLLYSLNSDKLNIKSSFSTIQTISQGPMVEGNTFSIDTVLPSLYKDSSTILSSAIEYSKYTEDIFDVFSSSQSTMKLSTVGIIETSVMKQIDEITSEIKQTPMHGQKFTTDEFNSQTLGFSKIETVQDDRLSTDALTMLNDGTVFSNMMPSELITIEHSIHTVSTEPLTSGIYNTPHIGILSRAYSETNFVPGLLTSSMMYSENLSLASNSFARGKDTDTEMLVFNTFNDLPIASKFQSETIMQGTDLSSNKNNLDLSQSSMLQKEQLSSLRNLQPSKTQLNDVSTFVSNFDIFEIMSEGTSYVESTRSLLDSPPTEDLKTARVELRTIIENVQGSQIISSQNDALTTSLLVPTESLNAVFEPFLTSLPYSDKRVTDTLSSHMQTVSFKFSDSSNTLLYSLNSDKLNIKSSFSTIQTISQGPMVEGNTFSVDTVLQSLYKGSSTIEDFGMEINSESREPINLSTDDPATPGLSSAVLPNIDTQSIDTVLQSLYKGSSTIENFRIEINSESPKPFHLTSNVPTTIGFSSSFPNTDTQRLLKQTELQPELLLTSASVDVLSGISEPTNSVLYMSSSLVDGSLAFSSEVKMFSGETLQPLSISPSSPIPDQHIPSVSNINQFTSPTSIDISLTKTFDTDKLTSDSIVSSPFTGIIANSSVPTNPLTSISPFEDVLSPMQTLVLESSLAISQDAFSNILRNYSSSEIVKNNVILNSQIIETVINTVNLNDNLRTKSSNFIPSTDFLTNKTYSVSNMDEHILDPSIVDYPFSAISSNTLIDSNTLDILSYFSINETTTVNKTPFSLFSSESQIIAPILHTPELFQHKPNSITLTQDPFTNIISNTMTIVSTHHSQAYQSELSSFQFFSDLDNTTATDMINNVLNNDTMTGLDPSYVTPIIVETSSIFPDMNQTLLFKGSLSETMSSNTLFDNVTDSLGDGQLFETISQTLDLSTISRMSTSTISQAQSDSFASSSLVNIKPPDPLDQTTPYDVYNDHLVDLNDGVEPSLNLGSQVIIPNTTDIPINVTPYFVGSDVIFSSFEPLTNLNMHEYVSKSSTQESLQMTELTDDKMFFDSDTNIYDIASETSSEKIETKSDNDSYVLFERLSYGKGNDSSVFTNLPTSGVPSSFTILPTTSLSISMLFNSFFKQNGTNEMIVTSIPDKSFFHQSTMSSLPIIDINNINDINFPDNEMVTGTLNYDSDKSIQDNSLMQRSTLDAMVSHFSPRALDASLLYTGVHGKVSRSENLLTNENGKMSISFSPSISYISSSYTQLNDILSFNEITIKKNSTWSKTIFPTSNKGILYSSVNTVDELLDPYMEISLNLDFLTHLSINTRTDWPSGIANSIYNGNNRNLESSAEAYFLNDENITVSSHHPNLYSDDLNSLSNVVSKQSMTSFHYLQNGNTPTLETPTAAFRLDTSMPSSSLQMSNQNLQKKSLSELPVYLDIANMLLSSTSNSTTNLELSSTLYNNSKFFTVEKFPIMKINKTDTFLGDRGVLTITDAPSSESSVDTFLFTAANDYDYYATDLDFVTDYADITASSSKESLISMSSSKSPVKSILDDPISLLNLSQPVTVSLPILPVSNSLEKQNVLAKAISGLPIVLPVQNETDIAKHKSTIISSQYYTDKYSSKATELVKETVEPSSQIYPKIDILPTPVITETQKPMTSSDSDIDMGMDMDYYDPFAAFFGGGDGGPAIPQWVIDMLGSVHDSPSSSAKHYFRH